MEFKTIMSLLVFYFASISTLDAQIICYDTGLDHSGLEVMNDSLEHYSCSIGSRMPEAVESKFKTFSVVEYALNKHKPEENANSLLLSILDSISNVNPYHLVFWWRPAGENNFGECQVYFSYPNDDDYQNCFTDSKIAVLRAKAQEQMREEIVSRPEWAIPEAYREIEFDAIKSLYNEVTKLQDCCANPAKADDACSLCPDEEELELFRTSILKLHQYGTEIEFSNDVDYSAFVPTTSTSENYVFYDFTGVGGLNYGNIFIDIEAELDSFVAEFGAHVRPTVYLMNDEAFCVESIDETTPNQTIFYVGGEGSDVLTKQADQVNKLEIGRSNNNTSSLFLDYLIDEYPEVFGYRIEFGPGRGGVEESNNLGGEAVKYCYYTPTGLLLYKNDYSPAQSNYGISDVYLAKFSDPEPVNTLYSFDYKQEKFRSCHKKRDKDWFVGYYNTEILEQRRRDSITLTSSDLIHAEFYVKPNVVSYGIVGAGEQCKVTAYKQHGCSQGTRKCQWDVTATTEVREGEKMLIPFNNDAPCGDYDTEIDEICCVLGGQYIIEIRQNDMLPQALRNELNTDEGKAKLKQIGSIICDIGTTYFNEYDTTPWGEMPDALKMYFDNSLLKVAGDNRCGGEDCNLDQMIERFENYRDRIERLTQGWDLNNVTSWQAIFIMLRGYEVADYTYLGAHQRYSAIVALSKHLSTSYWSTEPDYGTSEHVEKAVVRLITYQNPDPSETCRFVGMLLNSKKLLTNIFAGMSDTEFMSGAKDEYFDFVTSLMTLIKSVDCDAVDALKRQSITEVVNLGYFKTPLEPALGGYCDVKVMGDCFGEMTIEMPFPFPLAPPGSPPLAYACGYSNPFGLLAKEDVTIKVEGPLDYVPVNIMSYEYAGAGLLRKGVQLVPSFLLCFLRDYSDNASTRNKIQALVTVATIAVTIPSVIGTSGAAVPLALRLLGAIDIVGTVGLTEMNNRIETGQLRGNYSDGEEGTEEYNKFVNNYRKVEHVYNVVIITGTIYEFAPAAARGLARAIARMNPPPAGAVLTLSERITNLRSASKTFMYADLPNIEGLVTRFPDKADEIRAGLARFDEDVILTLDRDLLAHPNIGPTLVENTEGFTSYLVFSQMAANNPWRLDPDQIQQLAQDISASPLLKNKLLNDGADGVLTWKLLDDGAPNPIWCAN
jgi:hypothetical protein